MRDRYIFEYSIIRLVPKVEREEFVNIGVILFSKQKDYLGMRYTFDKRKLNAVAADLDYEMLNDYLKAWELICSGEPEGGPISEMDLPSRFRWLTASKSTIIQCSKPHPGLTEEPNQELNNIFKKFVL